MRSIRDYAQPNVQPARTRSYGIRFVVLTLSTLSVPAIVIAYAMQSAGSDFIALMLGAYSLLMLTSILSVILAVGDADQFYRDHYSDFRRFRRSADCLTVMALLHWLYWFKQLYTAGTVVHAGPSWALPVAGVVLVVVYAVDWFEGRPVR